MPRINQRKVLLINRSFQLSILGWVLLLALLLIGVFYAANWWFFHSFTQLAVKANLPPGHVFFRFMAEQQSFMNKIFVVASVFSTATIIFGGLVLSHRVAGPLFRLTQHLRAHDPRSVTPIRFRKRDYFPEIEEAFNEFIGRE
jgi:hypothetical protein